MSKKHPIIICLRVWVRGQVQGVGFRPFIHGLATELGLSGWVRNDPAGVELMIQGPRPAVDQFLHRLAHHPPPLARVDVVETNPLEPIPQMCGFAIVPSVGGAIATGMTPDAAVCPQCLEELFDPGNRRYRDAFIGCAHCGPRYTAMTAIPYDRAHTSMASFTMCAACHREYQDPGQRRFHSQLNACPECGPRLSLLDPGGMPLPVGDVIRAALQQIREGKILAVKGLGGFHLMCDARNEDTVARLRARKQREEKPFAIMAANLASIRDLVHLLPEETHLLKGYARPIVLLRRRPDSRPTLEGVAPGMQRLGVMLPYTPLQYLLFHEAAGRPDGTRWVQEEPQSLLLVCTSANPFGEPVIITNQGAVDRLGHIADALLVHNRDIRVRCDDSVVRMTATGPGFLRRGRGFTPEPVRMPRTGPCVLGTGAWYNNTACITRGQQAFLSQHVGDLDSPASCRALDETVEHLMLLLRIRPERIACDLHPDYYSTRLAMRLAKVLDVPLLRIQHHHAHLAAVQAEHQLDRPVLGLALDGYGLGDDGTAWGGELLRIDGARYQRLGHLRPLLLPGGDQATREPWRMAAAVLHALGRADEIPDRYQVFAAAQGLPKQMDTERNPHLTTSLGRLFDAASALLRVKWVARFEGQAPMLLEGLAARHGPEVPLSGGWVMEQGVLDFMPLLARLADGMDPGAGAGVFHATVAQGLACWLIEAAKAQGIRDLVLGGGCCLNQVLMQDLVERLTGAGFRVYKPQWSPPNDGGLSLGQAWIAMQAPI
ncbi:carbamoyltransferase HypF [Ectothiorhodospira shaposhnikovii]|uniref:carbamoyltransferase HypF n=1 Tax=Ectothiorhodospira shaposhnikovii TaxID=1054 RepID=UPI001EE93570|nr:carbamoyltransferase HypF [Ectothiorhodospira shaposhnikovii]MCG5514407.1 carbamoyltransferase HypF [Ectothiorhodospira shaposhnikovii]